MWCAECGRRIRGQAFRLGGRQPLCLECGRRLEQRMQGHDCLLFGLCLVLVVLLACL